MIPKIIHQTWKTETIPERWKDAVDSCKTLHKGYRYILWTHQTMRKFVQKFYPDFYPTYQAYPHDIQRCDAFRYLVLYKYGGIYLDLGLFCKKKLDDFLQYDLVLSNSPNIKISYNNGLLMVIPKHPFFQYCIEALPKHIHDYYYLGTHWYVLNSTGPFFLTKMIRNYGKISNIYILKESEYVGDCNACNLETCKGGEYFKQMVGRSWNKWDSYLYMFGFCHSTEILGTLLLATLVGSEYYYWTSSSSLATVDISSREKEMFF